MQARAQARGRPATDRLHAVACDAVRSEREARRATVRAESRLRPHVPLGACELTKTCKQQKQKLVNNKNLGKCRHPGQLGLLLAVLNDSLGKLCTDALQHLPATSATHVQRSTAGAYQHSLPVPHAHTASARTRTRARPHTRSTTAPHVTSDWTCRAFISPWLSRRRIVGAESTPSTASLAEIAFTGAAATADDGEFAFMFCIDRRAGARRRGSRYATLCWVGRRSMRWCFGNAHARAGAKRPSAEGLPA